MVESNRLALFTVMPYFNHAAWHRFKYCAATLGMSVHDGSDIDRVMRGVAAKLNLKSDEIKTGVWQSDTHVVLVVDIFEGEPSGKGSDQHHRNTPRQYADFIFQWRDLTRDKSNEIIFVLYHKSNAFRDLKHGLDEKTVQRLNGYFTIYSDIDSETSFAESMKMIQASIRSELRLHKP